MLVEFGPNNVVWRFAQPQYDLSVSGGEFYSHTQSPIFTLHVILTSCIKLICNKKEDGDVDMLIWHQHSAAQYLCRWSSITE